MEVREKVAKALYEDWQSTDAELSTSWEELPTEAPAKSVVSTPHTLRQVFLRKADAALSACMPD